MVTMQLKFKDYRGVHGYWWLLEVFLAYKYIKIIFKKKKIYFNTNTSKRSENIKNNSNF